MQHQLIIQFSKQKRSLIYQGRSCLRKNLTDDIAIYHDRILLTFDRKKPVQLQDCLFSRKSLFRYEIQKALCFYLAVTGGLPEVKRISLQRKDVEQVQENIAFAESWQKCHVERLLDTSVAAQIFDSGEKAKAAYIALTYYLKAQMDHFSHDRFRAAWSGLNVLYTARAPQNAAKEWEKIEALKQYFEKDSLSEVRDFVRELDEQLWKKLDWFSYTRNLCTNESGKVLSINKIIQRVFELRDSMLITNITDYMGAVVYTDQEGNYGKKEDLQRYREEIDRHIKESGNSDTGRAKFLIAGYCYMLRNRSFHAEKAYPLFVIGEEDAEKTVEEILTELILMTIEGLMREL